MSIVNRSIHLVSISKFGSWLVYKGLLLDNPTSKIVLPKRAKNLPAHVFTHIEIEEIMALPDITALLGIRDRAILEVLYSTGVRRSELLYMQLRDVDLDNGLLYVRHAKGGKQRVVPLGERAGKWLTKYLLEVRNSLTKDKDENTLFVNNRGRAMSSEGLAKTVQYYVRKTGKRGCCHLFRHAMASQMLEHGASLRHVQEMLGHEYIHTTEIYTHTTLGKLQEVYHQSVPACDLYDAKLELPITKKLHPVVGKFSSQPSFVCPSSPLISFVNDYLQHLALANYSITSIKVRRNHLLAFIQFCQQRGITTIDLLSTELLERYHRYLASKQHHTGPLSVAYIHQQLLSIKLWCYFLTDKKILPFNIAQKLELPRFKKHIPTQVLTTQEVLLILQQPDVRSPLGIRDRAILEVLYSTGMRKQELLDLRLQDIHWQQETVFIVKGKGNKQRRIPIGKSALAWIEKYVTQVRPMLIGNLDHNRLFINSLGLPVSRTALGELVLKYFKAAGITKKGSCLLFRHTLATTMLDHGADIRYIQQILGHSSLQATQIYTKVSIRQLKQVHTQTHPAKLKSLTPPDSE
jgi:integrase/recombinase XerD